MENKYYSLKVVLKRLIEEHRKIEKELQELTKYIIYDGNKLDDYYLKLSNGYYDKVTLECHYIEHKNYLERLIINLQKIFGEYYTSKNSIDCLLSQNGEYILDNPKHRLYIPKEYQGAFKEKADKILETEFATNIRHNNFLRTNEDPLIWNKNISFYSYEPFFIIQMAGYISEKSLSCNIQYYSHDDVLTIVTPTKHYERLTKEILPELKISSKLFNDYQQSLFEKTISNSTNNELFEGEIKTQKKSDLTLVRIKHPQI